MNNPARNDTQHDQACSKDAEILRVQADYWQDLEVWSDAFNDVASNEGYYRNSPYRHGKFKPANHCDAVRLMTLIRDGSDDLEAMRIIRTSMERYIAQEAADQVEDR